MHTMNVQDLYESTISGPMGKKKVMHQKVLQLGGSISRLSCLVGRTTEIRSTLSDNGLSTIIMSLLKIHFLY